jgi:hypothetical protein
MYAARLSICLLASAFSPLAFGYIDPGTGSMIIQGIIGAIAAIGVTLKIYWHKVKVFLSGGKKGDATEDQLEEPIE